MRKIIVISKVVVRHGLSIGSCTKLTMGGYFIIQDRADLEVATRHLLLRAKAIIRRTRALEKIAQQTACSRCEKWKVRRFGKLVD